MPKLSSGTGAAQAEAVVSFQEEWNLKDQAIAVCFDTTASNTGHRSDACILIDQKLDKNLLYLACQHHIMELVIGGVFDKLNAASSSKPAFSIFKRFQDQ